ncbi:23S rRNA (uracil(1939)-C(5))-methyltransferase RlmD [Kurthia sibirica]|uniref:23S rRNA (Uracil(1939)-C(5))-methyltransferase RlmD n=1 Tax=Kurthia sibirica TaxID=202750 RepID=A0A2U3ALB9_9BACL|nr:23S rRNA (uracil(1939)-C(5))-methyltransferase RlmD [Kurthia sibirica]PWI25317.1 23S rRNA (uracil(1939)-C(5))-methyltransferase RlmD [Kurthia sibirica]
MMQQTIMELGKRIPLNIKKLGINGEGIGYYNKNIVFVKGALIGEEIYCELTKVGGNFSEAKILKIHKRSKHRVQPPCPVYEECGGCQLQHMTYASQLVAKKHVINQALNKYVAKLAPKVTVKNTIGMQDPWKYRNKSQFQVRKPGNQVMAGLFVENSQKLLDIDNCLVQHPMTTIVTNAAKKMIADLDIPIYDGRSNQGIIRTIVVRVGVNTNEVQLVIITNQKNFPNKRVLFDQLATIDESIVSIVHNVNPNDSSLIFGENTYVMSGKETIHEELGEFAFDLSARAFFQLNPTQTVNLYDEIAKAAALTGEETVVDAYCGVGTIGMWLAEDAKEVRGMDIVADSIQNAKNHGIEHAIYETGSAETWLAQWSEEGFVPDVLTVDPPRTGLAQSLIDTILTVKPKRFVYTSCNPSTLAKDLAQLTAAYTIEYIQPIDMFPQTAHVESVTLLTLK